MLFTEQNADLNKQLKYVANNRAEHRANVFLKDGIKHRDYTIIIVIKAFHHQGDVIYGALGVFNAHVCLLSL